MTMTQQASEEGRTQLPEGPSESLPVLPLAVKDAKATRELLFTLRHFHLGDPSAKGRLDPATPDFLPALLDPFRDTSRLRYDYPLFLFPTDAEDGHSKPSELACPLSEWLQQAVAAFASAGDSARILKDHLPWIDHQMRHSLVDVETPVNIRVCLNETCAALQTHLRLDDTNRARLNDDIRQLLEQIPDGAMILSYGRHAALHLLIHSINSRVLPRRRRFRALVSKLILALKELFAVEWEKSDEAIEPAPARAGVGPGAALFDAQALSEVMDHSRGTRQMPAERRERIERVLAVLEQWQDDHELVHFVHDDTLDCAWLEGDPVLDELEDVDPCAKATDVFDQHAARLAEAFAAVRIAQLEINGIYDPVIHDPWFANFNWEGFSQDELLLVPTVVAVESANRVAGAGLRSLSRLLSSGRPVQVLVRVQPSNNPGAGDVENPFQNYRTELGYLAISHRQAVVAQSSTARSWHLIECFLAALDATRTGLHLISTGQRPPSKLVPLNAWLIAGAALEGRAHPFFHINPEAGDSAAARMNFKGNPQRDRDWPVHPFSYQDENENRVERELAFTFADYALLIERLRDHFRLIPPGCDSDALVAMQDYLAMKADDAYQRVPFIWAVDGNNQLHRLVVSRELALACLDRLNYWHSLQELAGIRNRYVELAIERTRTEEREAARLDQERLQVEHAAEVNRVRDAAAGEAMQRLADLLMGIDFSVPGAYLPAQSVDREVNDTASEAATDDALETVAQPPPPEPAAAELSFDEPWIDTPLCTSCNDCLKVNPLIFLYNEEKQAYLGDLDAATYAQLVEAAELCPAKCIHPGAPLNPDEPNLEELIERAAPFNR